ncbi:hypothetical protein Pvag_pPag20008 (plasmid) [Pantoea vagans C9-1]|nr:hypothetical protein Pvag_pPag20008 [Pantoea vagans C9-1]
MKGSKHDVTPEGRQGLEFYDVQQVLFQVKRSK